MNVYVRTDSIGGRTDGAQNDKKGTRKKKEVQRGENE
jgi:hypothetical protein